jgi:thiamine biosynthesis protein ThiI
LKRGNRRFFEDKLVRNLRKKLEYSGFTHESVYRISGRIIVDACPPSAAESLAKVFGVSSASPARKTNSDIESLKDCALDVFNSADPRPTSFRITANRLEKKLGYTAPQVNEVVGAHVLCRTGCRVDLTKPELEVGIELTKDAAYVFTSRVNGVGGLPVSSSGKVLVLLSGGIDSPCAAWLCMRRGCEVTLLHFLHEGRPKTVYGKMRDILLKLREYHPDVELVCVPVSAVEREIMMHVPAEYRIIVLRRIFLKISERFCRKMGFLAIASGDNIGQVASQTLENISVISEAASCLLLRPLACFTKQEIIDLSKRIGMYETSIEQYSDCCSFLLPRHPATKADKSLVVEFESRVSEAILEDAFTNSFWVN